MRLLPALIGMLLVTALPSCAPTLTAPQVGRIVNSGTGEEGSVSFARGSLRPQIPDPFGPENVTVRIGGQTYTGRSVIVNAGGAPLPGGWGLSVGFSGGRSQATDGLGWDTRLDSPAPRSVARTGNLIARTSGPSPRTLTCTLTVDQQDHGIGECSGSDGAKYALQF